MDLVDGFCEWFYRQPGHNRLGSAITALAFIESCIAAETGNPIESIVMLGLSAYGINQLTVPEQAE